MCIRDRERLPGQRPGGVQQVPGYMHTTTSSRCRSPHKGRREVDPLWGDSPDLNWRDTLHDGIDKELGDYKTARAIAMDETAGAAGPRRMVVTIECVVKTPIGFGLKYKAGAVTVHHVVAESNAEAAGIYPGDVILQADNRGEECYESLMQYLANQGEGGDVVLVLDREVEDERLVDANAVDMEEWQLNKELKASLRAKDVELQEMSLRHEVAVAELELMRQTLACEQGGEKHLELNHLYHARLSHVSEELSQARSQLAEMQDKAEQDAERTEVSAGSPMKKPLAITSSGTPKGTSSRRVLSAEDANNHSRLWREQIAKENRQTGPRGPVGQAHSMSYPYTVTMPE
eukprot:TRINITY_DN18870_c0_g1_i1.p1 TRINITY_DN18870_c0_g1~~TRINITY_DN18870_c0_g1_i1.p1  ORF type:complete len:346 (+),score=118.66 TRINITY_DN18870_c0_g1_i1:110-1147(+)